MESGPWGSRGLWEAGEPGGWQTACLIGSSVSKDLAVLSKPGAKYELPQGSSEGRKWWKWGD